MLVRMSATSELAESRKQLKALEAKISKLQNEQNPYMRLLNPTSPETCSTRQGPLVTPKICNKNQIYSKEDKLRIMLYLDKLPEEQRTQLFRGTTPNQYTSPPQLRLWYNKFKKGEEFGDYGRPLSIKRELFKETVETLNESQDNWKSLSRNELDEHLNECYQQTTKKTTKLPRTTKYRVEQALKQAGFASTTHPNRLTEVRYNSIHSPRRLLNFYSISTAVNSQLTSLDDLYNSRVTFVGQTRKPRRRSTSTFEEKPLVSLGPNLLWM